MTSMEKRTPHYSLAKIQAQMASVPDMNLTVSARSGIRSVGMAQSDALAIVQGLSRKEFYKSMTTHADHTIWQDVYRTSSPLGEVYLKLTVVDDLLVVSFKEL